MTLDLAWSRQAVRAWVLPGESDLRKQWTRQPELPARAGHQPGPAIGGVWMPWAHGGPAQGLLEKAEGMFVRKSAQVPAPERAQVGGQRAADPRQPQRSRRKPFIGQPLDVHAHHAEGSLGCTTDVEITPHVDAHGAVSRVSQLARPLRLTVSVSIDQSKGSPMQAGPPASAVALSRAIHHAVFGQADEQVSITSARASVSRS